jgi:hypothetical protein
LNGISRESGCQNPPVFSPGTHANVQVLNEPLIERIGWPLQDTAKSKVDRLPRISGISACVDRDNWYIAVYSSITPTSAQILCIEKKSGKTLWTGITWGEGIGGYEGGGFFHVLQVLVRSGRGLVFGGGLGDLYVQGLSKSDGSEEFYFSTHIW